MDSLHKLLHDNNIIPYHIMEMERQEKEYYTVTAFKLESTYVLDPNQPMIKNIPFRYPIVQNKVVFTEYMFQQFCELLKLEHGIMEIKIIED